MQSDRVEKSDAHGNPRNNIYNADVLRNVSGGAYAAASGIAATMPAAERLGPTLREVGSTAAAAARSAAPIAGETLGAAGLVLMMQSSAGNAGEDAPNAMWRQHSNAVADRTPQQAHTSFPGQRIDDVPNHTTNPAHVRPAKDGILATPAETQAKPAHTGHASPDLRELTKPTGTTIQPPKAADQATLAKQEKIVTSAHAAHLAPNGTLAHADRATIDVKRKVAGYALDPQNEVGKNKARVFKSVLGYDQSNYGPLVDQIRDGIKNQTAVPGQVDKYGVRFSVDVPVTGPAGSGQVRTSWIYRPNSEAPDLTSMRVQK
jgi:hypothetical protein